MTLTAIELQEKLDNLRQFYAQRNLNMEGWRNYYFRAKEAIFINNDGKYVSPEPDEVRIVLPIATSEIESTKELLLTKPPVISVPRSAVTAGASSLAEHNEKALWACWERTDTYERLIEATHHALVDGWGVIHPLWNKKYNDEDFPLVTLSPDPINVYPLPGRVPGTWQYVIHSYDVTAGSLREEWVEGKKKSTAAFKTANTALSMCKDTDVVTFIDYWDDTYNAAAISFDYSVPGKVSERVSYFIKEPTKHNYGFMPWVIFFTDPLPYDTIGERMGVGRLWYIQDLIPYMSQSFSEKATYVRRHLDPTLITKTNDGRAIDTMHAETGGHIKLETEEDAGYMAAPPLTRDAAELMAVASEYLDRAGVPKVMQGQYVGAVSGVAMNMLRTPTLMKIAFKQKAIERALIKLNYMYLRMLEKFLRSPYTVWGRDKSGGLFDTTIDPDGIGGYYQNDVKLSASLPSDDASTVNMLASLNQLGILSVRSVRDVAQQSLHDLVPQSLDDETAQIIAEKALSNPELIAAISMYYAQQIDPVIAKYMEQQKQPQPPGNPAMGDKEVTMPSTTVASQTPGMPGGNTDPTMKQRMQEMVGNANGAGSPMIQ